MSQAQIKVDPRVETLLRTSGVEWSVRNGNKHAILIVAGEVVGTIPRTRGDRSGRATANFLSCVRRRLKEVGASYE